MARDPKPEFSIDSILNNPVDKKALEGFIEEIVLHKQTQKAASLAIGDIRTEAKDKLGIPGKKLNAIVKARMNPGSITEMQEQAEDVSNVIHQIYDDQD